MASWRLSSRRMVCELSQAACQPRMGFDGTVERAEISYIIRDHDTAKFEQKKSYLWSAVDLLTKKYGDGVLTLTLKVATIALVHMPVHHVVGIPGFERCVKAFKSSMWQIIQIAHAGGGRMGQQDVAAADHPHFA